MKNMKDESLCPQIFLPAPSAWAMAVLERTGFAAYLVGGCLRDILRGVAPHDWDVTTPALPGEMLAAFEASGLRTVRTGEAHGTVAVVVDGEMVECTTFRVDGTYTDARHPDSVTFTPRIEEDLARRDFTVNAIACRIPGVSDARRGEAFPVERAALRLIDPYGGETDLAAGILRCVGDPRARFTEDALRILRAVRFSVQLGFAVDKPTEEGMRSCRAGLSRISAERIAAELCRMLTFEKPSRGLSLLLSCRLFERILPEVGEALEKAESPKAFFAGCDRLPPVLSLRLAYLLSGVDGRRGREACNRLRLSNALTAEVSGALRGLALPCPTTEAEARRRLYAEGTGCEAGLTLAAALRTDRGREVYTRALALCRTVRERGDCLSFRSLAIDGKALMEITGLRGQAVGEALHILMDAVLENPALNTPGELQKLALSRWGDAP